MASGKWGTITEASKELGVSRSMVYKLLKNGRLGETRKIATPRGAVWLIRQPLTRKKMPQNRYDKSVN